jgi:predicted nuclease of predicted toxin-antitoxin system
MLQLLSDENFHGNIVRGLFLREPNLDLVRVQDVGLQEIDDPTILDWAATNDRIVLTHDRSTMPDFAYDRLLRGEAMPDLFVISNKMQIGQAIDELLILANCSEKDEWKGVVLYLPL